MSGPHWCFSGTDRLGRFVPQAGGEFDFGCLGQVGAVEKERRGVNQPALGTLAVVKTQE